jgi:hypothetical protein
VATFIAREASLYFEPRSGGKMCAELEFRQA